MAGGPSMGRGIRPLRARGFGTVVLIVAAAAGLPLTLVTTWINHGFMTGTLAAMLVVLSFNIGLVVGFVLRTTLTTRRGP